MNPVPENGCCVEVNFHSFFSISRAFPIQFAIHIFLLIFCVQLKKKYSKLQETRNALRDAVKLLEQTVTKFQAQNVSLKKGDIEFEIL